MLFLIIEILLLAVLMIFGLSQIIIPAFKGRTLFPFFKKQGKLEKLEAETRQEKYNRELKSQIDNDNLRKGKNV